MPKTIAKPVGFGGANLLPDVRVVQFLLNCVPYRLGGPRRELVIDGYAGPVTIEAIRRFQRFRKAETSGCVLPAGRALEGLQSFDPFPAQALPYTAAKSVDGGNVKGRTSDSGSNSKSGGEKSASDASAGGSAKGGGDYSGVAKGGDAYGGGAYDNSKTAAGGASVASKAAGKDYESSGGGAKEAYQAADPWGFYNPASPYFGKAGFGPGAVGKGDDGKTDGGEGGSKGESPRPDTGTAANPQDPWGFYDPTSKYFHMAGKAGAGRKTATRGASGGGDAKSGSGESGSSGGSKSGG